MTLEEDLKKIALESYYMTPTMVKFLLIENLTMKTLLHAKGLITPEEFHEYRAKAAEVLDGRAEVQLKDHLKGMMECQQNTKPAEQNGRL